MERQKHGNHLLSGRDFFLSFIFFNLFFERAQAGEGQRERGTGDLKRALVLTAANPRWGLNSQTVRS